MGALNLGELLVQLGADSSDLQKQMSSVGDKFTNVGKMVAKFGLAVGAAMGGAAVAAGKMAVDFEREMSNVGTLLGEQGSDRVKELGDDIKAMAQATGKPLSDLASGAYQIVSAFGDSAESAKLLEIAAKASAAGLSSTEDAVNLLSAVTKGYGDVSAKAVQSVSDMSFQVVKLGQTNFPQLASAIGKVVPLAVELGVAQEELFGVMATATGVTGSASEVSTQLSGVFQSLMAPTKDMSALLADMGFASGKAMLDQLGLQGSINAVVKAAKDTGTPMQAYMGSIEGQTLALALAGPQAENFTDKLAAMTEAQGASDEAFRIQQATVGASMDRIKQSIAVVGVTLGEQFLPLLATFADWVSANLPAIQGFFDRAFKVIGGLFSRLGEAITWFVDNVWQPLLEGWETGNAEMQTDVQSAAAFIGDALFKIMEIGKKVVEAFTLFWGRWGDEIMASAKVAWETISAVIGAALKIIGGLLDFWIGLFTGDWSRMADGFKAVWGGLWDGIKAIVGGAWQQLKIVFGGLYEAISGWFKGLISDAADWGASVMRGFWDGLTGWFSKITDGIGNFAKSIGDKVKSALDIKSPSGVFEGIGQNIGAGLAQGLEASQRLVDRAAADMAAITAKFSALSAPRLAFAGIDPSGMEGFVGRVQMATGGFRAPMAEAGQAALSGGGGVPNINVYIGERQLEDIYVELAEKAYRRGRTRN